MTEEKVVVVEQLSKVYRLYDNNIDRVKESLNPFGKRYSRDFFALQDVSFAIKKGETIGIIGKNGAGKSTLLKVLTGVITPTSGKVQVHGKIAALLELGAGFNPEMTGIENIYLNGTIMGFTKAEIDAKLQAILDFADIGDFINQPVKMYSSGMFARLAFAVNANVEPDILIVDEALAVGDIFFQNKCYRKFKDLRQKGTTIIFVSHDIGSVKQLCTRAIWLEKGKVKMLGNTDNVCDNYFNAEIEERNKTTNLQGIDTTSIVFSDATVKNKNIKRLQDKKGDILSDILEISSFIILNRDGRETTVMKAQSQYSVHITLAAKKDVSHCILGITLTNRKGIDIIGTNTYQVSRNKTFSIKAGEVVEVVFTFSLPGILPGSYIWDTAAANGTQEEHVILTWRHGVSTVEIINEQSNRLGIIDVACELQIQRMAKDN